MDFSSRLKKDKKIHLWNGRGRVLAMSSHTKAITLGDKVKDQRLEAFAVITKNPS